MRDKFLGCVLVVDVLVLAVSVVKSAEHSKSDRWLNGERRGFVQAVGGFVHVRVGQSRKQASYLHAHDLKCVNCVNVSQLDAWIMIMSRTNLGGGCASHAMSCARTLNNFTGYYIGCRTGVRNLL